MLIKTGAWDWVLGLRFEIWGLVIGNGDWDFELRLGTVNGNQDWELRFGIGY